MGAPSLIWMGKKSFLPGVTSRLIITANITEYLWYVVMLCALFHLIFTTAPSDRVYYYFYLQTKKKKKSKHKRWKTWPRFPANTWIWAQDTNTTFFTDSGVEEKLDKPGDKGWVRSCRTWWTVWNCTGRKHQMVMCELEREFLFVPLFLKIIMCSWTKNTLL